MAPLGLLGWHTAVYTYLFGSTALFILALVVLARRLPLPRLDPRMLYFAAFALAMAPLHSGIHEVNLNTVIIACLCAGAGFLSTRPYCSGIAIAIAMCLKPQVGIFFFAYPWLRKKWKTAFAALGTCSVLSACSLVWMKIHHFEWLGAFLNELSRFSSPNHRSSPITAGTGKFQLLNLQVLTFQFTHSPEWSKILAWILFALLAGVSGFLIISRVSNKNESAGIAMISILTLLPVYQHYYTAEILLFVLYWAIENRRLKGAKAALLLMLPLLFPFATWAERAGVASRFAGGRNFMDLIWNGLLMPHVIWIELILLLIVLASLYRKIRPSAARLAAGADEIFAGKAMQRRVFWSFVCLIAVAYFIVRGPLRGYESSEDFAGILDSSRCWTLGLNPYLPTDLATCSLDQTPASTFAAYPEVHPPSTFLLLAPLARLPFPVARAVWITLLLALTVLAGVRLARAAPGWDLRVSCFVMAFSPIHTALRLGQTSMLTCALIALSLTVGNPWLAGVLLGLAACFKWNLAAWFVLLAAWNDWRTFVAAAATCCAAMSAAIFYLKAGSLAVLFAGMSSLTAGSGLGSGSSANPLSYQLLNVDALLPGQWHSWSFAIALYVAILLLSAAAVMRTKDRWTAIAITAAASAFAGYHRFYDAGILCLAIPALLALPYRFRWLWGCFAVFLVPGQTMAANWLGPRITGFWSFILLRHEVIACLLIWAAFTFYAIRQHAALNHNACPLRPADSR